MAQDYAEQHFEFDTPGASPHREVKPFWRSYLSWFFYGCVIGLVIFTLFFWVKSDKSTRQPNTPYLQQAKARLQSPRSASTPAVKAQSAPHTSVTMASTQPTFDFYTLLPEGEDGLQSSVNLQAAADDLMAELAAESMAEVDEVTMSSKVAEVASQSHSAKSVNAAEHTNTASARKAAPPQPPAAVYSQITHPAAAVKYTSQVASFKLYQDADELRATLLLNGFNAKIEMATDRYQQAWHRVVLGPFNDKSMALRYCQRVQEHGHDCLVLKKTV